MKNHFRTLALGMGLLGLLGLPMAVQAGMKLDVNIGVDDQAHFDFKAGPKHHHPMIWKAAMQLLKAKKTLLEAADDFGGHKAAAIAAVNAALDQLKICETK